MRRIGAIDQGTTSTRFLIVDESGRLCGLDQREHRQIYPQPGWVEHDAAEIWSNTRAVICGALGKAGLSARDLSAIGIANQRETVVLWDRATGAPLHPALVWMDTRARPMIDRLSALGESDLIRTRTGLPLATYFSASKLSWLLDNVSGARQMASRGDALFGTIDSWLTWNLTGGPDGGRHITDATNASRTQLMNLTTLEWDEELLELFSIPSACLPEIRSSSEIYGSCVAPLVGVPIAGAMGDQQAALLGQACLTPGTVKNTYGTGCFMLMNTGTTPCFSSRGLITTLAWKLGGGPPVYALEGSIAIAGALVQWLRDNLGLVESSRDIEALARSVEDNGDVYFVPAFSGLFAPYWREDARGIIAGLTAYSTKAHIARAALESTAYQTRDALRVMGEELAQASDVALDELRVDGGMAANDLLMQFQADLLDIPVTRPENLETTALGAIYAAMLATGLILDVEEIAARRRIDRRFVSAMEEKTRERLVGKWSKAVARALDWTD